MKIWNRVAAVGLVYMVVVSLAYAGGFTGRCPVCIEKGYKSKVQRGASVTTLMASIPYYDENGKFNNNDPNTTTTSMSCSSGHTFVVRSYQGGESVDITSSNDAAPQGIFWLEHVASRSNLWISGQAMSTNVLYAASSVSWSAAVTNTLHPHYTNGVGYTITGGNWWALGNVADSTNMPEHMLYVGEQKIVGICLTNGKVTIKDGVMLDEASRAFWKAVELHYGYSTVPK